MAESGYSAQIVQHVQPELKDFLQDCPPLITVVMS